MSIAPTVPRNASIPIDVYMYESDNVTPLTLIGGAVYTIFAPNGMKVMTGVGTQDVNNPAHWTADITIPTTAPISNYGEYYTLQWIGNSAAKNINSAATKVVQSEKFLVQETDNVDPIDTSVVTLSNSPFTITLVSPYNYLKTFSARVINTAETVLITQVVQADSNGQILPISQNGSQFIYQIPITTATDLSKVALTSTVGNQGWTGNAIKNLNPGVLPYAIYLNFTDPAGNQQTELQFMYVANTLVLQLMNNVRSFVDKIKNWDNIPQLRYTERDLMQFLISGLMRFNAENPAQVAFAFPNLPTSFYMYVEKCAQYELLQAQYLAEGMTSFEFSGMSTSLTSDRTQYIATLIDNLKTDIDKISLLKKNFARSSSVGSLNAIYGPNMNFMWNFPSFGTGLVGVNGGLGWVPGGLSFL